MNINVYSYSDMGNRDNNEDSLLVMNIDGDFLAEMADGLGGYNNGELASSFIISSISEQLKNATVSEDEILSAVENANNELLERQKNEKMMSTIALLWIKNDFDSAFAVNAGDTRIYQFRENEIIFQSVDHSVAQMAVYAGEISASEIRDFPGRNKLIRALGANDKVKCECMELDICSGDSFLLCTDGFWELITEDDMISTLKESGSPEEWICKMREVLEGADKIDKDNNSAIAVKII